MLCYAMLCYAMLCYMYAMLCCVMLGCICDGADSYLCYLVSSVGSLYILIPFHSGVMAYENGRIFNNWHSALQLFWLIDLVLAVWRRLYIVNSVLLVRVKVFILPRLVHLGCSYTLQWLMGW